MPWKIQKDGRKFCVVKETDGSVVHCHPTRKAAVAQIQALNDNVNEQMERLSEIMLEGNPVILGVAVTNRPVLPLPPMEKVDIDGTEYLRVPFLRKGIYQDPRYGKMVFNEEVFDKMIENFNKGKDVNHHGVSLDLRHDPKLGALAWFDTWKGGAGIKKEEDSEYGELLVGYGKLTKKGKEILEDDDSYIFSSVDYDTNFHPSMVQKLSADDLTEIQPEDLIDSLEEDENMSDITIAQNEYDELKAKAEKLSTIEATLKDLEGKVEKAEDEVKEAKEEVETLSRDKIELESKLKELETEDEDVDENVPESTRKVLEAQAKEISELRRDALVNKVDLIIAKAQSYRDENGRGHSPVLLELAKKAMLGSEIQTQEGTIIKLEGTDGHSVARYERDAWRILLETIPGQVQMETKSEPAGDEDNPFDNTNGFSNYEFKKEFWSELPDVV